MRLQRFFKFSMAVALALGAQGAAAESDITYALGDSTQTYGTGGKNAETIDVALHIADKALAGAKIKGVRIAFPFTENLSNAKAWLSKQLPAIKSSKAGSPDVTEKAFAVAKGYTEIVFDEPYTLTEDGIYVGYSFDVAAVDEAVRPIVTTGYTSPEALLIHSTKIFRTKWRDQYQTAGQLAIQVLLSGEQFKANAVAVAAVPDLNVETGIATPTSFEVENHGFNGVQSVEYTVDIAGQKVEAKADVTLKGVYGAFASIDFTLPAVSEKGSYPYTVTITKVNGVANEDPSPAESAVANVYNVLPKHRAVLEEYTGTWCGYCPRGFVGLEEMNRLYPKDFIGISYHNGDPMEVTSAFPSDVQGFPDAWLDRVYQTDAFCGDEAYGKFGIDKAWLSRCDAFAPAAVEVESKWTDDHTLEATAHVTFPLSQDECPYEVGFILVQDGMTGTGSSWAQSNYYNGAAGWPESMDQFTQGGSKVIGLIFNDVFVARSGLAGIEGSLTAPIEEDVTQDYTYAFNTDEIVNTSKENIVQDKSKLRVVALLINNETGEIVNANKAQAGTSSGIQQVAASAEETVNRVVYYDLQGRRVSMPQQGLYIKSETLRDGKVRTRKVKF